MPARRVEAAAFPPLLASDRRVFLIYAWEKEGGSFSVDKEDAGSTILESLGETLYVVFFVSLDSVKE